MKEKSCGQGKSLNKGYSHHERKEFRITQKFNK